MEDAAIHNVSEEEVQMSHEVWNTLFCPIAPILPQPPLLISFLPYLSHYFLLSMRIFTH